MKISNKKTQIQISKELANRLKKLMMVGDTYEIIISKILDNYEE